MRVHGAHAGKSAAHQIEVGESGLREVGGDAEKAREAHKKCQMEIGVVALGGVEPLQGRRHEVENLFVGLLAVHHMEEHLG